MRILEGGVGRSDAILSLSPIPHFSLTSHNPPPPNPTPTPLELHSSHVSLYSERSVQNYLPIFLLSSSHKILDVGSGLGGPARHLAHTTNCSVTCLELQEDLHSEGQDLTRRCNLQEKVTHISGDFLKMDLGQ